MMRAAFGDTFNGAEVMTMRAEDRNARQIQQAFADGATLAELEKHIAFLRSLGAPDDAHPNPAPHPQTQPTAGAP